MNVRCMHRHSLDILSMCLEVPPGSSEIKAFIVVLHILCIFWQSRELLGLQQLNTMLYDDHILVAVSLHMHQEICFLD